mgnify:FL=1
MIDNALTEPEWITDEASLAKLYGAPRQAAVVKVASNITDDYAAWINASPFFALASAGPEGLDCSPRGDAGSAVDILNSTTIALPDRRGNNRIDTLRNVVRDPRVALMFLIPGSGTVLRVNGTAKLTADETWCVRYAVDGKLPRSVLVIAVREVYFQCSRAVMRSALWKGGHTDPATLPSVGAILERLSAREIDGEAYDQEWPTRAAATLW